MTITTRVQAPATAACVLLALLVAIGLAPDTALAQNDTTPPELVSVSIAPNPVDVTTNDAEFTVTLHITDDSGIFRAKVQFDGPSGQTLSGYTTWIDIVSANFRNGTQHVMFTIPAQIGAGNWTLASIDLIDTSYNVATLTTADLVAAGFPTVLTAIDYNATDLDAPELVTLSITPATVNVSVNDADFSVDLEITDDLSGVLYANVRFDSPTGEYVEDVTTWTNTDPNAATHTVRITIPFMSGAGDWTLSYVELFDAVGNYRFVSTAELDSLGFPTVLSVLDYSTTDVDAPELVSFSFAPANPNVFSGDRDVFFRLRATDDSSGVDTVVVRYRAADGSRGSLAATLDSGTALDGQYLATLSVPKVGGPGEWFVTDIVITDLAGRQQILRTNDLDALGLPFLIQVVSNLTSDTTPPFLVEMRRNPAAVDVRGGAREVLIDLRVIDDLSGSSVVFADLYSPSLGQSVTGFSESLIAGTPLDGVHRVTLTVPEFSEAGDWVVSRVGLHDQAGNQQNIYTPDLAALGFPTTVNVTSNQDVTAPQLTRFTVSPASINVSAGPATLTFTMGIVDALSGVSFCQTQATCFTTLRLSNPAGEVAYISYAVDITLVSGTPHNGTWQIVATLPRYSPAGTWKVESLTLVDLARNVAFLPTATLQARGFTSSFTVVSSPTDAQAPQLTGFSFAPSVVDVSGGSQVVNLTVTTTDNLAGMGRNPRGFEHVFALFTSPSGGQNLALFADYVPVAGSPTNSTWRLTATLPQYAEAGSWVLQSIQLADLVANRRSVETPQLRSLGSTTLTVIQPSLLPDGDLNASAGGTVSDAVFGPRAQVIAPPGVLGANTSVSIDVLGNDLGVAVPAGFSSAGGTGYVSINLTPRPAYPLRAPGLTLVLPLASQRPIGTALNLFRIDPATGNLVRAVGVDGRDVVGTVNADGLSATFRGVARLSTVVGLESTGAVAGDVDGDGLVNCADIAIVRNAFGKRLGQAGYDARADINRDNVVSTYDLAFVSRRLPAGVTCRITPTGAVPATVTGGTAR